MSNFCVLSVSGQLYITKSQQNKNISLTSVSDKIIYSYYNNTTIENFFGYVNNGYAEQTDCLASVPPTWNQISF
jgi:hypothetical protein